MLTVEDDYKNAYIDINRSSLDRGSIRQSIEPTLAVPASKREPKPVE